MKYIDIISNKECDGNLSVKMDKGFVSVFEIINSFDLAIVLFQT